jgi:hypothetical protein
MVFHTLVRFINIHLFALCAGILGGIISVLLDIDHPLSVLLGIDYSRFLHPWVLAICGITLLAMCAYFARLCIIAILRKRNG